MSATLRISVKSTNTKEKVKENSSYNPHFAANSLIQLISDTNRVLNEGFAEARFSDIEITSKGNISICIDIVRSWKNHFRSFIDGKDFYSINSILDILGFTTKNNGSSLADFVQWARGPKILDVKHLDEKMARFINVSEWRDFPIAVLKLYNDGIADEIFSWSSFLVRDKTDKIIVIKGDSYVEFSGDEIRKSSR